ncbi:unnamed protein product [Microthlaspi erraticum]|uniref:Uncharacterized protein n=1 Tax=Microthlaspi erraticum TaxID=1685480 RepID=A0A6D2KTW2_9BRAS|nr:unnamed protein product [Microthlaspi erraticum]
MLLMVSAEYLVFCYLGTLLDGKPIINIPPKKLNLSQVDFSVEERSFYMRLQEGSRSQFKDDKRKMAASAFGEDHGGSSATRLTVDDLNYLWSVRSLPFAA